MRCWLLAAASLAAAAPGCSSGDCTAIGCSDGVMVRAASLPGDGDVVMRACVDGRCTTTRHVRSEVTEGILGNELQLPDDGEEADVRVTLRDPSGRVLASGTTRVVVHDEHPNGVNCEPACGRVSLRVEGSRVVAR